MSNILLPVGKHREYLHIRHSITENAGPFQGGGHKVCWHTTEGHGIDTMVRVLREKRAAPHLVIDPANGHVVQMIPFNRAARALEHPAGTPITNQANVIQVEIVGFAKDSGKWDRSWYRNLAMLAYMIEKRYDVPRRKAHGVSFLNPHRIPANEFIHTSGHLGHAHVPNQPSGHWDPGKFKWSLMASLMPPKAH